MGSAITITSSGNDSGLTFTVLGTLADGTTNQSDVIKGANAGMGLVLNYLKLSRV